jgi:hypothetical protein
MYRLAGSRMRHVLHANFDALTGFVEAPPEAT